jgi:hypothetical protein
MEFRFLGQGNPTLEKLILDNQLFLRERWDEFFNG